MKLPSIPFSSAPTPSPDTGTAFVVATRTSDTWPGWRLAPSSSQTAPATARKPLRGPWPSPPGNRKACLALACTVGHACQVTAPYRISELRCGTNLGRKGRERERGNIAPGGGLGALADALANDPALRFRAVCLGLQKGAGNWRGGGHRRVAGAKPDGAMVQIVDQGDQHARPAAQTVLVEDDRDVALAQDIETDGQVRWVVGDCGGVMHGRLCRRLTAAEYLKFIAVPTLPQLENAVARVCGA